MKIGLTGGAGFLGGHVIEELVAGGHQVIVFDHRGRLDPQILSPMDYYDRDAVSVMLGDVRDATAVTELAAHVDGIIHLAAVLGTQETIQNPGPSAEINILGSLNVFEAANQYGLPVVYAGVGNHWMRDHGTGSYTISKSAAEDFTRMFNQFRGGRIAVVRPVNAYGPRQSVAAPYGTSKVRKIMPSFICRALTGSPIEVYGDGTQVSDCVYVKDVAHAFITALEITATSGAAPETPVEVGPEQQHTVNDIASMVAQAVASLRRTEALVADIKAGPDTDVSRVGQPRQTGPVPVTHLPMRPGEVPNAVVKADTTTLKQIGLDASHFLDLQSGITTTVAWYAQHWLPTWQGAQ